MTGQEIREELFLMQDLKYKKFHERLVPGKDNIIGVRLPDLRGLAKRLLKEENGVADILLETINNEYYEEIMLKGLLIGLQKNPNIVHLLAQISDFIPMIDNWAICDSFCGSLKEIRKYRNKTYDFIQKYLKSDKEYEIRFALVMLLDYYIDQDHLRDIFFISEGISHEGYYVRMANAWLLSICFVKYYNETKTFFENCNLDNFTYNKALQKARESIRIDREKKEELNSMKKR